MHLQPAYNYCVCGMTYQCHARGQIPISLTAITTLISNYSN